MIEQCKTSNRKLQVAVKIRFRSGQREILCSIRGCKSIPRITQLIGFTKKVLCKIQKVPEKQEKERELQR